MIFSNNIFFKRFRWFLTLKIDFENQILAFFDIYFWQVSWKNQYPFCDQGNYGFNVKCFYQIPLTWWKTYRWVHKLCRNPWTMLSIAYYLYWCNSSDKLKTFLHFLVPCNYTLSSNEFIILWLEFINYAEIRELCCLLDTGHFFHTSPIQCLICLGIV